MLFIFQATRETHTWKMNGIHKFQVHAIKTSMMRIFTDNRILFKAWLSSTEALAFLICTQLVVISSLLNSLTFFSQIVISDADIAELPLAMKWASVVVTACHLGQSAGSLLTVNLTSSACIAVERPACFAICRGFGDAVENMYIFP